VAATNDYELEFFVEPFQEGKPGRHVNEAVAAVDGVGLTVKVGAFGSTTRGGIDQVRRAVDRLLSRAFAAGATKVTFQISREREATVPLGIAPLHDALKRMIRMVETEIGGELAELPREKKQAAIHMLDDLGAFMLRKSIDEVADEMAVSRITVYNYLNAIRSES
jgi:uncharacterized protein YqgV (UPF0045/DUF77 family)